MKNLKLSWEYSVNFDLQSEEEFVLFSAFDIDKDRMFFASSDNVIYTLHLPQSHKYKSGETKCSPVDILFIDLEMGDSISSMDYLMEKEALIVGTNNGNLLLHTNDDSQAELVGQVEGGVKCMLPSPDGDLLVILTGIGQMLVMTSDWDLLYESSLEDDADVYYSFDGSISWRGDGKYFSTLSGTCNQSSIQKKLKIWERDSGVLSASSEVKAFMGIALDWMPSGAKIAAVYDMKAENKCPVIVFYEKNGLERSSFNIDEPADSKIEILKWNCSSDLLASVVRGDSYDSIKIWYFSNNHWYLKQEIKYQKEDKVKFTWDPIKPLKFICWTIRGQISTYNYVWITAVTENSISFIIDGPMVLVTPLYLTLMPPPMYLFCLKFPSAVREIAFSPNNSRTLLAASLSNGCLSIVELSPLDALEELEGKEFDVETCESNMTFESFSHLTWLDSNVILGFSQFGLTHGNGGYHLHEIELVCPYNHVLGLASHSGWHAKSAFQTSLEDLVIGIASNPAKSTSSLVQFNGGSLFEYSTKLSLPGVPLCDPNLQKCHDMGFSFTCPWMTVVSISDGGPIKPFPVGLDETGRLHVGKRLLCNNCKSFSFYSNSNDFVITHLILATKQDLLFIVDIYDILHENLDVKYGNFIHIVSKRKEDNGNFINIWERGADIVGILHGDEATVIIQTIRGNLESIYPRKLVLASILHALVQERFSDAIQMVRRHRIDFNIIVDQCGWKVFLKSAPEFVKQVNNLSYITEFICALKNENITETLYKSYITLSFSKKIKTVQDQSFVESVDINKVSSVLLAIRKALENHVLEIPARELCILTTLARSDPPDLENALERIKIIREMELIGLDDPRKTLYPSAEEALKHLLWLSDSEAVYEAALGLYDLNLSAMVALNSQRDPKEFLPFLQELERMPPVLMRYNVDLKLHRFESALKNIASAGDAYYDDCMNLMKNNPHLFPLGLQIFTDPVKRKRVLEAWGDHFSNENCFDDAAAAYLSCSCLKKALKAYSACGNWSGVLTVAGLLKLGKEEILKLAHELCEELQMAGKPGEAARIALEYCGDVASGISLLISARDWEEALRVGFLNGGEELISTVKNASIECADLLICEYKEGLEKVGKYLARYLAVRQRRLVLAAKLKSEEQSVCDRDDDISSETSSNFSGMSAYTTETKSYSCMSSKAGSKRSARRQRNKGKIRAGSGGEELGLVDELKSMSLTDGAKGELKSLLMVLLMLGEVETARMVQHAAENIQLSQMAAIKLTQDTLSTHTIHQEAHTLAHYLQTLRTQLGTQDTEAFFWRSKLFISP